MMVRKRPSIFGLNIQEGYTLKRMQYFGYIILYSFLEQVIIKINDPSTLVTDAQNFSVWSLLLLLFVSFYFARAQSYRLMDIFPKENPKNIIFIAFIVAIVLTLLFIFMPLFGFIFGIPWGIYLLVVPGKTINRVIHHDIKNPHNDLSGFSDDKKGITAQEISETVKINDYLALINDYKHYLSEINLPPSSYNEAQLIYFLSEETEKLLNILRENHTYLPSTLDINQVVNRFVAIGEFCDVVSGNRMIAKETQELKLFGIGAIKDSPFPYNILKEEYRNDVENIEFTVDDYHEAFKNYQNYLDSYNLPESLYTTEKFIEQLDCIGQLVVDKFVDSNLKLPTSKALNTTIFRFLALNEILHPDRAKAIYNIEIQEMILYGVAYLNDKKFPI